MTLRSEPLPGCPHCNGIGVVSVSKDPDWVDECSCITRRPRRNPILVAYRDRIAQLNLRDGVEAWLFALDALGEFGGYTLWDHPKNIYHSLTIATPREANIARRVLERLAVAYEGSEIDG